jgi:hypothetical protein
VLLLLLLLLLLRSALPQCWLQKRLLLLLLLLLHLLHRSNVCASLQPQRCRSCCIPTYTTAGGCLLQHPVAAGLLVCETLIA